VLRTVPERCPVGGRDGLSIPGTHGGSGINDRLMLRYGDHADQPVTLAGDGESFTFVDHVYVRIGEDRVVVSGDLRAMKVRVKGHPRLVVNGQERDCTLAEGRLTFVD
jgi:hypothetical protein